VWFDIRTARGESLVAVLWARAREKGAVTSRGPALPGDLVFFEETYDRNRDGFRNDGLTHVGIVESVEPDGTVTFIHRGGSGVARARVNPSTPGERASNDYIRRPDGTDAPRLTGQLLVGFAAPSAWVDESLARRAATSGEGRGAQR
jgi:hypothetical protein